MVLAELHSRIQPQASKILLLVSFEDAGTEEHSPLMESLWTLSLDLSFEFDILFVYAR